MPACCFCWVSSHFFLFFRVLFLSLTVQMELVYCGRRQDWNLFYMLFHMCHPLTKPTSFIHLSRHCGSIKSLKPPLRSPPTQWQSSALLVCFIYIVIMCIHIYIYFLRTCTQTLFSFPGCYFCIELSGSSIQKAPFHKLTVSTMPVESTC